MAPFPGAMFLITEGDAYFFSKYLLFDCMRDAYFKATLNIFAKFSRVTLIPETMFIQESRVSKNNDFFYYSNIVVSIQLHVCIDLV